MRRIIKWAAIGVMAVAFGGCTAVRVSHVGRSMVDVENNGWLLFDFIPIASGDTHNPESHLCKLFQDSVTLDNNIDLINYAIRKEGAVGVRDLVTYTTDEYVLFVLMKRHCMHTSAVLVMPGEEAYEEEDKVHRVESIPERTSERSRGIPKQEIPIWQHRKTPIRNEPLDSRPPEPSKIQVFTF